MNKIIKFSQKEFLKILWFVVIIQLIVTLILFFSLWEYKEFVYFLSMMSCFIAILILFYKIRYYPYIIVILNDNINIEYLNKSFFRVKSFQGSVSQLKIEFNQKQILLYNENSLIAQINNNAISEEDKETLITCIKHKSFK